MPLIFWIFSIAFVLFYIAILFYLIYGVYATISGAPFVPSKMKYVKTMIELADLKPDETCIDLGSGEGRIVFAAAPYCKQSDGVELSPMLYWTSKLRQKKRRLKNVTFMRDTLWNIDLSPYDVIFIYFIPHRMKKLKKKIFSEMKPGSRVVSHAFSFPDWQYSEKRDKIYLYSIHSEKS